MPYPTGLITTYNVTDNKIHLDDIFEKLRTPGTPLLNRIRTGERLESTILQWYEDYPVPLYVNAVSYNDTTKILVVDDSTPFKIGNIVKVKNFLFRITNINHVGKELYVVKISGPATVTILNGDKVMLVSDANPEASTPVDTSISVRKLQENVTQIFTEYLKFSGTQREVKQWVRLDLFASEVQRKLEKLRILMEKSLINGQYYKPTNSNEPRMAGGIDYFITNSGITVTGQLTEQNFKAVLRQLYDLNNPEVDIWMHPHTKEQFFNGLMYDKVIVERTDQTVGRLVQRYVCEYGEYQLNTSPHIEPGVIYFINERNIEIRPLRPFAMEELAKTGDFIQLQILGEYTFKVENSRFMAKFVVE